jgi:hypothetical protein
VRPGDAPLGGPVGISFKGVALGTVIERARAKRSLAVIVAYFIMQLSWLGTAAIMLGSLYALLSVFDATDRLNERHMLAAWICGATCGGFWAAYLTPKFFRDVRPSTIANGLICVAIALFALSALPVIFDRYFGLVFLAVYSAHGAALVIGAKIGQSMAVARARTQPIARSLGEPEALRRD